MTDALSRRSVLRGLALTCVGGVAGFVVARNSDAVGNKSATTAANSSGYGSAPAAQQALAKVSDVPAGGGVVLDNAGLVLTKDDSGQVHGFSNVCTHQGCKVTSVEDGEIICPCHGSKFDANTGEPTSGPAQRPLPSVSVVVNGDEIVAG